jgi:hypothetical protein
MIRVNSVIEWLKTAPVPENADASISVIDVVDTNERQEQNGHMDAAIPRDDLFEMNVH